MPRSEGEATCEEATMDGARKARMGVLVALLGGILLLLAATPGVALAAWTGAQAAIADPEGTGVVPLLNVSVANHATNDSSHVTTVQLSEDGRDWYAVPYTGEPCDWVLGGTSGHKTLLVRFGAQDGSVSPIVKTAIDVDTTGPITAAGSVTRAGADRHAFRFVVRDAGSPRVSATIVVRGHGATRRYDLGNVRTGAGKAVLRLRLPSGSYSWRVEAVDLAGWEQERQAPGVFKVK
jgi:hypothetical protein